MQVLKITLALYYDTIDNYIQKFYKFNTLDILRMKEEELQQVLRNIIVIGEQETICDIPLPQIQIENLGKEINILVYSSVEDKKYHQKIINKIKGSLNRKGFSVKTIRSGNIHPKGNSNLCFLGTRLQLNAMPRGANIHQRLNICASTR